jgi:glycine/D-amino acid oxidase-like deaminating enzyme
MKLNGNGRVAVVGAGMVGVCSALWLQRKGFDVVLIDRMEPGNGASYGNACTFATYASVPINSPTIPRRIPSLLFGKDSPLSIDWGHIVQMTPWLLKFLANCTEKKVARIAHELGKLLKHADDGVKPLFSSAGVEALLSRKGCLYLYDTEASFEAAQAEIKLRQQTGVNLEILDANEIRQMEPRVTADYHKGLFFPDAFQFLDPRAVVQTLAQDFVSSGGCLRKADVQSIEKVAPNSLELGTSNGVIDANQVVISAGAWSKNMAGRLMEKLPLETERGYHVVFEGKESLLNRPVGWASGGFYMTPMSEGLRVAGTVELGSLSERKNQANIDYLTRMARGVVGGLDKDADASWLGFRPSMPDALPVIGRSEITPEIILAFGHQHIGMTLGGVTGQLVSELAIGQAPSLDIKAFSPNRF